MQLFGLVNALLLNNDRTVSANQADYSIQRYAVMPLSPTAGLISWVPSCDTLHDLIRSYRESRKIMLDVENKLILQVAPNKMYDALPVMHKLEVSGERAGTGAARSLIPQHVLGVTVGVWRQAAVSAWYIGGFSLHIIYAASHIACCRCSSTR